MKKVKEVTFFIHIYGIEGNSKTTLSAGICDGIYFDDGKDVPTCRFQKFTDDCNVLNIFKYASFKTKEAKYTSPHCGYLADKNLHCFLTKINNEKIYQEMPQYVFLDYMQGSPKADIFSLNGPARTDSMVGDIAEICNWLKSKYDGKLKLRFILAGFEFGAVKIFTLAKKLVTRLHSYLHPLKQKINFSEMEIHIVSYLPMCGSVSLSQYFWKDPLPPQVKSVTNFEIDDNYARFNGLKKFALPKMQSNTVYTSIYLEGMKNVYDAPSDSYKNAIKYFLILFCSSFFTIRAWDYSNFKDIRKAREEIKKVKVKVGNSKCSFTNACHSNIPWEVAIHELRQSFNIVSQLNMVKKKEPVDLSNQKVPDDVLSYKIGSYLLNRDFCSLRLTCRGVESMTRKYWDLKKNKAPAERRLPPYTKFDIECVIRHKNLIIAGGRNNPRSGPERGVIIIWGLHDLKPKRLICPDNHHSINCLDINKEGNKILIVDANKIQTGLFDSQKMEIENIKDEVCNTAPSPRASFFNNGLVWMDNKARVRMVKVKGKTGFLPKSKTNFLVMDNDGLLLWGNNSFSLYKNGRTILEQEKQGINSIIKVSTKLFLILEKEYTKATLWKIWESKMFAKTVVLDLAKYVKIIWNKAFLHNDDLILCGHNLILIFNIVDGKIIKAHKLKDSRRIHFVGILDNNLIGINPGNSKLKLFPYQNLRKSNNSTFTGRPLKS